MGVVELNSDLKIAMGALTSATSSISSTSHTFLIIAQKIENTWKDIATREAGLVQREKKIVEKEKQLELKEDDLIKRERAMNKKEKVLKNSQEELEEKKAIWEENERLIAANLNDQFTINMGMLLSFIIFIFIILSFY